MENNMVISFDMEGTLIDHSFSNLIWETEIPRLYADEHNLPFKEAKNFVLSEYDLIGEENPLWYDVGYWFTRFGLQDDWHNLLALNSQKCEVYPEVSRVLEHLSQDYALIITSNTIREFLDLQLSCLNVEFERVFSAPSDFGLVKKNPEFYEKVCESLGLGSEGIVHIGDHYVFDYIVPKGIGIEAYYLDRSGDEEGEYIVKDLEAFMRKLEEG